MLRHQARQVRGRTQCAALHLWQAEGGVVGGDDHVSVAHKPDAAADAETVHRGHTGTAHS